MDYQFIFFILFFILWIYMLDIALDDKNNKIFCLLQFGLSIPLIIFIANNSYVSGFAFGYLFAFIPSIISLSVLVNIFYDNKKNKR